MNRKTNLIIGGVLLVFLIPSLSTYYAVTRNQVEPFFLANIYGSSPTRKPILIMTDDPIETFTSSSGKEFIIYSKKQIEQLVNSSDNPVFYKTIDITIILGFPSIQTESYSAFHYSGEIVHVLQGGSTYYGVNIFGKWYIRNFGQFSVNY